MWHDEPANRPGQDPNGTLPVTHWESHYRERIAHYEALTEKYPAAEAFARSLENYRTWMAQHMAGLATEADGQVPF